LTSDEQALSDIHVKTLQLAAQEKAVSQGVFFDLMYVNPHLQRQYAFLRHVKGELLLVVANFESHDVTIDVNVPSHAFDYLGMKEKKAIAVDLLTKEKLAVSLKKDGPVRMEIKANSARVWKVKL
jgi:hypothetical protein